MFHIIGNYWKLFIHTIYGNLNHVHIHSNSLLSVIIILETDGHGSETVLMMEKNE